MENKIAVSVFTNEEFGEVRAVVKDEEVWFVDKDIAKCDSRQKGRPNAGHPWWNSEYDYYKRVWSLFLNTIK